MQRTRNLQQKVKLNFVHYARFLFILSCRLYNESNNSFYTFKGTFFSLLFRYCFVLFTNKNCRSFMLIKCLLIKTTAEVFYRIIVQFIGLLRFTISHGFYACRKISFTHSPNLITPKATKSRNARLNDDGIINS